MLKGALRHSHDNIEKLVSDDSKDDGDDTSFGKKANFLKPLLFTPQKVATVDKEKSIKIYKLIGGNESTRSQPYSLEDIVSAQIDERGQKNCIYQFGYSKKPKNSVLRDKNDSPQKNAKRTSETKYAQIRVKSIEYL